MVKVPRLMFRKLQAKPSSNRQSSEGINFSVNVIFFVFFVFLYLFPVIKLSLEIQSKFGVFVSLAKSPKHYACIITLFG